MSCFLSFALLRRRALCLLALLATFATAAHAQTAWTVNTNTDTASSTLESGGGFGPGSGNGNAGDLRYVLFGAMAQGGVNTVTFACGSPCTIVLSAPLPPIFETTGIGTFALTIDGGTPGNVILDGGSLYRVFFVDNVAVTLKNLIIQNALARGGNGGPGAAGGGGGAGFGAGLFVNQATASVVVQNTSFLNCSSVGGTGGASNNEGDAAGGGGMTFPGGANSGDNAGAGGGVSGAGQDGTINGANGGAGGGGGASEFNSGSSGGAGYANNPGGQPGVGFISNGGKGGSGGFGGGGGAAVQSSAGSGGFGGGGAGGVTNGAGNGGFGGGGGGIDFYGPGGTSAPAVGGIQGGTGGILGAGGGAAAGPAIFVVNGSVTLFNTSGSGFSATPGAVGAGAGGPFPYTPGTANPTPVFNYAGTVNGSTSIGPIANAFTVTQAVGSQSPVQTATLTFTTAGTPSSINVLTQGAPNLDFNLAGTQGQNTTDCNTTTAYSAGQTCTVQYTVTPAHPGTRFGAITLSNGSTVLAGTLVSAIGTGPQITYEPGTSSLLANLLGPNAFAVDASNNLFVAVGRGVTEVTAASNYTTQIPLATGAGWSEPADVALDGFGNAFVIDLGNNSLKEITAASGYTTAVQLAAANGNFSNPTSITTDLYGNVYITDYSHNAVKEVLAAGGYTTVQTLASSFNGPDGIGVDSTGNVFVSNYNSGTVQEILAVNGAVPSSPQIVTLPGNFPSPADIKLDATGNVYLASDGNGDVYRIAAAGGYANSTVVGSGFQYLEGVFVGGDGRIYVSESPGICGGNIRCDLREIDVVTPPSLTFPTLTQSGATDSADPAQVVSVFNDGNQPLVFLSPSPDASTGFSLGTEGTSCDQLAGGSLAPSTLCTLTTTFAPASNQTGAVSGSITLTDNALNIPNATQSIPLSGTAIGAPGVVTRFDNYITTIAEGNSSNFLIYIYNPNSATDLSNITVTVQLSSGLSFLNGTGGSCGGTTSGSGNTVTLSGVNLAGGAVCQNGILLMANGPGPQSVTSTPATSTLTGAPQTIDIAVTQVFSPVLSTVSASPTFAPFIDPVTISANVLDIQGLPIQGATVVFSAGADPLPSFTAASPTDQNGNTSTSLSDTAIDQVTVTASVGGVAFAQPASVTFLADVWYTNANETFGSVFNGGPSPVQFSGPVGASSGSAFDSAGNFWSVDPGADRVITGSGFYSQLTGETLNAPAAIAIDGNGTAWVANSGAPTLSVFANNGKGLTTSTTAPAGSLNGVAIDISGDVWVTNATSNAVTELLGAGAPTIPLATGQTAGTAATKP